jgi:hypothetical protein
VRNRRVARLERLLRVVSGHDDDDFLSVQHRWAGLEQDARAAADSSIAPGIGPARRIRPARRRSR